MNKPVITSDIDRSLYIGSSDAKDIIEGNYDKLYRIKKGLQEVDLSDHFAAQLGAHVEPFHISWTMRRLNEERGGGYSFSTTPRDKKWQHFASYIPHGTQNAPLLGSHPDALLTLPDGNHIPLEVKLTARWSNADEAADYYMAQLQHHMICWNVDMLLFSVIVGTQEPERMWIGLSHAWAEAYVQRCDDFWGYLQGDQAPAPVIYDAKTPAVPPAMRDSVPINGFKRRSLDGDNRAISLIPEYVETKKAVARHEEIKNELKGMMADDENELYTNGFKMKRDARGAIRFTVDEAKLA